MLPLGHLSLGYLLSAGFGRLFRWQPPDFGSMVALTVATQLPDIVDKPLSWTLGVLPTGRTLTHSLFTAVVVSLVVHRLARTAGAPGVGRAFAIGYGSHLLGDLYAAATSDSETLLFLFWPLVPQEPYSTPPSPDIYVAVAVASALVVAYLAVFAVVAAVSLRLGERRAWLYPAFVLGATVSTVAVLLLTGVGLSGYALELVLAQIAVAVWVRDGTPGLRWART
jgi:membrane-bound metal-dependent hydrolase YbcI (DUF457 family)